ncbi:uncharacterized protein LOC124299895 [Neodiprion virginianus]|uniref:uncharacterized protein LOC124179243 n=1 Tax=Neodiprion fabricii TaxID=2872261 RepID=UPI001ED98112|nr:uncharacterized protein LOC124179243 [Neodiprion fabricii]XP_046609276.1 uncharacterized protein LOC124299895 [Neodiprion virginianus]XP_046609277.1 uncharacterized protein LOC124299895 [Neodiprion virginianus]XP_046609278.1 uncharacterized protein LOC124299895 [Neodiprion virginianus]XP_046609279.1 uncharacterized protein LOC124299895 [Neodiprion virginianus]
MAVNSPDSYGKSPKSIRHLPQPPQASGQKSPTQRYSESTNSESGDSNSAKTKTTRIPRTFDLSTEYYPQVGSAKFDCEEFGAAGSPANPGKNRNGDNTGNYFTFSAPKSPNSPESPNAGPRTPRTPRTPKSPSCDGSVFSSPGFPSPSNVFQFCNVRRNLNKTMSYPPKSPITPTVSGSPQPGHNQYFNFSHAKSQTATNAKKQSEFFDRRRSSCFNLGPKSPRSPRSPRSPMSPTIIAPTGLSRGESPVEPKLQVEFGAKSPRSPGHGQTTRFDYDSPRRGNLPSGEFNRSQGCLVGKETLVDAKPGKTMARRSTSDLTDLTEAETQVTMLSSPAVRRRGSMKAGLAYLASRRGSRDSQASNLSNVSNEDVGPLNFTAHPRGRQRRTSNFLELPVPDHVRPRVHSLPEKAYNPRACDDLYRLRAFSITHKGVVNRGDSIISRRSRSNTSVNSGRNSNVSVSGERSPFDGSCCSAQGGAESTDNSDVEEVPKYRVVLLGDSGVGKTALVSQFMTSEYMNTYDASLDDEFGEKTVSILLDEEESEMIFIDHPNVEMSVENSLSTYEPHACIVIYSIVSRASFEVAEEILNYLWREHFTQERAVIVVGNKADLARSRTITANEGKQLATSRECKFIETSSGIQHNVDELLVGVLKQIRLRESRDKKLRRQGSKGKMLVKLHASKTALSLNLAREILSKMCINDTKSKSCENLHVL